MVSESQRRQFAEDGFVFIDPELDDETIDGVVARVGCELFETRSRLLAGVESGRPGSGRVQDAWSFDEGVKKIVLAPAILAQLAELYGRNPKPFQTLNFRVGTQQLAHSDTVHFNCTPSGFMCGVWVALEDIDETNGAVAYYPGSHKLPEFNLTHVFAEPDLLAQRADARHVAGSPGALLRWMKGKPPKYDIAKDYPIYERFIQRQVDRLGLKPVLATLKKGQAFIWAANLLHGGSPQADANRTRHSQVNHYYFDGCRYHRPLVNTDGKIRYFEPAWII